MKKLYSKILLTAILFFSYAQTVFTGQGVYDYKAEFIDEIRRFVLSPLLLFSAFTLLFFIYSKLQKKDLKRIRPLFILGGLSLPPVIFSYLMTVVMSGIVTYSAMDAIKNDNLLLILTFVFILSLIAFICYLILTIVGFRVIKLKKNTTNIFKKIMLLTAAVLLLIFVGVISLRQDVLVELIELSVGLKSQFSGII